MYALPVVVEAPAEGEDRSADTDSSRPTKHSRVESPKLERRKSMPTIAETSAAVVVALPAVAAVVPSAGEAAVAAVEPEQEELAADEVGQDSMAARRAVGKAQIGKTAQMMLVRLELLKWGLGTRIRHDWQHRRSLFVPPPRPEHERSKDAKTLHLGAGVGQQQRVETRSNEDA